MFKLVGTRDIINVKNIRKEYLKYLIYYFFSQILCIPIIISNLLERNYLLKCGFARTDFIFSKCGFVFNENAYPLTEEACAIFKAKMLIRSKFLVRTQNFLRKIYKKLSFLRTILEKLAKKNNVKYQFVPYFLSWNTFCKWEVQKINRNYQKNGIVTNVTVTPVRRNVIVVKHNEFMEKHNHDLH